MDDLIKGINDPDMLLTDEPQGISDATDTDMQEESLKESESVPSPDADGSKCWQVFMNYLDNSDERSDKDERLVCKLDRDLADSLDDCDIHNRSRSDLVNAIVRPSSRPICRSSPSFAERRNHCLSPSTRKTMKWNRWNEQMVSLLVELYPVETTAHTAAVLEMSVSAVKYKAKELGLGKLAKSKWLERADHIRSHFNEESFTEIGEKLGITRVSVSRIASRMGLKRTKHEGYRVSSRVRQKMVRRERRRLVFGLDPITQINVISNRAKVRLRYRLKVKGYVASGHKNLMYYTDKTYRKQRLENRGMKLGIRFQPFPQEELIVVSNFL